MIMRSICGPRFAGVLGGLAGCHLVCCVLLWGLMKVLALPLASNTWQGREQEVVDEPESNLREGREGDRFSQGACFEFWKSTVTYHE